MASFIVYGDASGQVTVAAPAAAGTNTITFPAETGTLITSAYTGAALPGQIAWDTTVKTSGFTAVVDGGYFCNTTSAAFTVTLPASPARGDFVVIVDYAGTAGTNNITIGRNGNNINGVAGDAAIRTNRQGLTLTYIDSTQGWLATSNVYATSFAAPYTASYLVVAGGGSGGSGTAGGGGAGGYLTGTLTLQTGTVYTATIGGGGAGGTTPSNATNNGSNSTFPGVTTAVGGGNGAGSLNGTPRAAGNGGSGGGGAADGFLVAAGTGTPGQGNNGGAATPGLNNSGGGGGAGAVGSSPPATQTGANGGTGLANSITGTPATYAGGGGGGGGTGGGGAGGAGGGGAGSPSGPGSGVSGTANTGGGGGGSWNWSGSGFGSGGSGVVILSVPTANYSGTTTGSPTITTSGSNTIIRFTATGTYTA
jgi:hypothetical protein